jgi:hypothetical protein
VSTIETKTWFKGTIMYISQIFERRDITRDSCQIRIVFLQQIKTRTSVHYYGLDSILQAFESKSGQECKIDVVQAPFINDDSSEFCELDREEVMKQLSSHKVCKSALRTILDFGIQQWKTV